MQEWEWKMNAKIAFSGKHGEWGKVCHRIIHPEQLCHVLLPQAARLAEFFNVVLHLQRQNFHIKSANITTGMKIRFTISPASALLDGGFSSSSFAAR